MSKKRSKKSRKKDETSDPKKHKKAEIASKEQPSRRLSGSAECTKTKRILDLKDATKILPKEFSKDTQHICGTLMPAKEHEKITMHFKNKVKHGGKRSNTVAFPSNECSDKNLCSDPDVKRRKTESQGLRILKSKEKHKIKTKAECVRLKEVIVKSVLDEFKETTLPTECSLHHKKETLKLYEFSGKQNSSKEPHPAFPPFNFLGPKSYTQACRESTLERTKHTSFKVHSKNDKEKKCVPLCHLTELSKCWKYKQKGQLSTDSIKNIGNSGTQRNKFEPMAFHVRQISTASCSSSSCEAIKDTDTDQEMQIVEDLHAARIDKKMALSVVQTCGELTSMEIDLPEDESNKSSRTLSGLNTLIVVDTNIMISHLEYIKFLKNKEIPGIGRFVLVIPWVVLQELDNLKRGKILASVGQKAIPAVHFIYICLKNQDPKLWGQSMQLASQKTHNFSVENNDDRVLQCCLQYRNLFPQAEVVLLTDDKNLCNKALVSEVKAFSKADLVMALQKLTPKTVVANQDNSHGQSQSEKASGQQGVNFNCACIPAAGSKKNSTDLSRIILESQKSLGEVLSSILETELKIAYGDLWTEVVYHKPPWTLAKVLECYKKHWMAVFGMVISRSFFSTIEYLYTHLCTAKIIKQSTMKEVLLESKMLLETFSSRSNYDGVLSKALAQMNKLLESLEKSDTGPNPAVAYKSTSGSAACEKMEAVTSTEHTQAGVKSLSSKPLALGNRHMEIWSVLESVWNTINLFSLEVFQKLDLNSVTTTENMSSFKEAFVGLQKLMAAVNEILAGIRQVLVTNSSFQDIWPLYSFLTNNEINNSITFTAEELYDCVSQEVYRDRLPIGCGQLAQLEHTIKQCYESVCLEIKNRGWL